MCCAKHVFVPCVLAMESDRDSRLHAGATKRIRQEPSHRCEHIGPSIAAAIGSPARRFAEDTAAMSKNPTPRCEPSRCRPRPRTATLTLHREGAHMNRSKGVSLIEVMLALGIVALLVGVAIPALVGAIDRVRIA
ncbi:MAG: type II secretion system protein, partial [Lysobacter sp.]